MPLGPRVLIDGGTYHVLMRGNNGQTIFQHDADHQRYLQILLGYLQRHQIKLYHFVLMPSHVHLVLQIAHGPTLSKIMSGLNLAYSHYYRKRYRYSGHLWQGRFKSLHIDKESYLLEVGRYVELNPVRAALVQEARTYPWSSYRTYAEGSENPLVTPNPLYELLGATAQQRQGTYRQFVLDGLRRAASPLGTFTPRPAQKPAAVANRLGLPLPKRKRGRPRKALSLALSREVSPKNV